jgi:hypothetical protein
MGRVESILDFAAGGALPVACFVCNSFGKGCGRYAGGF